MHSWGCANRDGECARLTQVMGDSEERLVAREKGVVGD